MTFSDLATFFKRIESTPSRLAMTEILAELFTKASDTEIGEICFLLTGRVVPLYEALEFGMADKFVIRAIGIAYGVSQKDVEEQFKKTGDLGIVAESMAEHRAGNKENNPTVHDIFTDLTDIAHMAGTGSQEQKITRLAEILSSLDPLSARFIVRIPLDKLRLGFSEMTMLDAFSWMITGDKTLRPKFEDAYNVRPDIGYIATMIKKHGKNGVSHVHAKVGAPILASLCQRLPTADEMIEKMGEVAVEPKYDGVRVQIHYKKHERDETGEKKEVQTTVNSYSRNLENTTAMFPELDDLSQSIHADEVILDCEAVGIDPTTGKITPFQETTTRKRKHDVDLFSTQLPIRFFVFDILFKDGKELLSTPLSERRTILEHTIGSGDILSISPQLITSDPNTIRQYHDEQIKKGLEGVVVKKWHSPYEPGRRGFSWVKFKEEEGKTGKLTDTIDCVVMGYYQGEGKRAGFGIGAFLVGVKKGESFVTISKIGTGVSDELWLELKKQFERIKVSEKPKEYGDIPKTLIPDIWTHPTLVVEIAGDDLTISPNHGAGIAIRFPRLVKIRTDKNQHQVTTVYELKKMYDNQ